MMNYIQLSIKATEAEQEILISQLNLLSATGFEQTNTHLLAYFDEVLFPIHKVYEVLKKFDYSVNTVQEQNWNADWEQSFQPITIDDFCAVRAHFHPPVQSVKHEIIITPKMSFGTGHHATTYLMLQHMEHLDFTNKKVLDFGTGTGILAILAEKLGAADVLAIDNDAWSFENVQENIQLNHCSNIQAKLTDQIPVGEKYDIILANITKNVLLDYMGVLKSVLVAKDFLLLSGFLENDKIDMAAAAQNWGMKVAKETTRDGWTS